MLKLGQVVGLDIVTQSPFQPTPSVPSLHICIQRAENYSMKKIHPSAGKVYQSIGTQRHLWIVCDCYCKTRESSVIVSETV